MNNENFHPVLHEPPVAHALHRWNEETRTLTYEYNGRNIVSIYIPGKTEVGFRHGSDGNIQSNPFIQNVYIMQDSSVAAKVTFTLSDEAINMRPHRAGDEQSILGQVGRPLLSGVNGMYDIKQDLLIEWSGCPWEWYGESIKRNNNNELTAELAVRLGSKPWMITFRMQYYKNHLGYTYHAPWNFRPNLKAVSGWCSWEACRRSVAYEDIKTISQFFSKQHLESYGFEYIQLDDGYEKLPLPFNANNTLAEGWLETNEKFPHGHTSVVDIIQKNGFNPAIWTNANVTNREFVNKNIERFITGQNGEVLLGEWIDYLLDCSPQTLESLVYPYYKGLNDMGYVYFKTDAIRHLLLDGLHEAVRQGLMSNAEAENRFRHFMEYARKGIGDKNYFLASWGVLSEAVGLVDACRIAMDANPTWAGVRMQLVESARWFHTQRILFVNDPDHICARTNIDWLRSIASLTSLSGSLYMLSDPLEAYDAERLLIIKKTLPTLMTFTGETGPLDMSYPAFTWTKLHGFAVNSNEKPVDAEPVTEEDALNMAGMYPTMYNNHPISTLWSFHLVSECASWCVVGRFATIPLQASLLNVESLSLKKDFSYHVFDFWDQKYLGSYTNEFPCKSLELGKCQILAFRPDKGLPQFLASSRHVSMDAISVVNEEFTDSKLNCTILGVCETSETYWFTIPERYTIETIEITGGTLIQYRQGPLVELQLTFTKIQCEICILFTSLSNETSVKT